MSFETYPRPGRPLAQGFVHVIPGVVSAYTQCRLAEQEILLSLNSNVARKDLEAQLVCIRVLGYLLAYAPSETARAYLANDIPRALKDVAPDDEGRRQVLASLGQFYRDHFLRMCVYRLLPHASRA